VGPKRGRDD